MELRCGSHVSRLLTKLPHDLKTSFQKFVNPIRTPIPTLLDLAEWLEYDVHVQVNGNQYGSNSGQEKQATCRDRHTDHKSQKSATILHSSEQKEKSENALTVSAGETTHEKPKKYCPFCDSVQHYLNQCNNLKLLLTEQKTE